MSVENTGNLHCQRKFVTELSRQGRLYSRILQQEMRLLSYEKENEFNFSEIKGREESKHWSELVDKYWKTLVNVIRSSVFLNKSLWKLVSYTPTGTGRYGCCVSCWLHLKRQLSEIHSSVTQLARGWEKMYISKEQRDN